MLEQNLFVSATQTQSGLRSLSDARFMKRRDKREKTQTDQQRMIWFQAATIKFQWCAVFTVAGAVWLWTVTCRRVNNVFMFCMNPWDLWCLDWSFIGERRKGKKEMTQKEAERSHFKFLYVFYQWHLAAPSAPPSYFSPLSIENRCSSIPDYFYPTFHYHNKTHAWKKR